MHLIGPPSSWYDPPDEPSDAEEDMCRDEWLEYLAEGHCDRCVWTVNDDDTLTSDGDCAECAAPDGAPMPYDTWCADWHDSQRRRWAEAD